MGRYPLFISVVLAIAALSVLYAQSPQDSPQAPSFHSSAADLVVLPVTVTDKHGRFASNLPADRFTVFDNSHPREIALFSSDDTPVSVAIVVDNSGSMRRKLGEVIAATSRFAALSNPDDEVVTIQFNDSVHDMLDGRHITAADEATLAAALGAAIPEGRTALYDAVLVGLQRLQRAPAARKVLILISDGGDNASHATLDDAIDKARKSDTTIYSIGLVDRDNPEVDVGVLKKLAETTGGSRFLPETAGALIQACQEIAHEIRSSYTVAFAPLERDGKYHDVKVKLSGPDAGRLQVRTRQGYLAAKP